MLLLPVLLVAGCGSSDSPTTQEASTRAREQPPASLAGGLAERSEAICRNAQLEIKALARGLAEDISGASGPDAIGGALVVPGIRILERESARLAKLDAASAPPQFGTYTGLFDPIIELSEQRLEAGQGGDLSRAHELELLIAGLTEDQAAIAREMGLSACGVDFTQALGA